MDNKNQCLKCTGIGLDKNLDPCGLCFGSGLSDFVPKDSIAKAEEVGAIDQSARKKFNHIMSKQTVDTDEESNGIDEIVNEMLDELKVTDYKDRLFAHDMFLRGFFLGIDAEIFDE